MHGTEDVNAPPACNACREGDRICIATTAAGNRIWPCDQCRRRHKKCVFEDTEADQKPANSGKKRRCIDGGSSDDPKGKRPRRQSSDSEETDIQDGRWVGEAHSSSSHIIPYIKKEMDKTVKNDSRGNVLDVANANEVAHMEAIPIIPAVKEAAEKAVRNEGRGNVRDADADRLARVETTLQELTETMTRTMTAVAEERRDRAVCDRTASETINIISKVMLKIVDAGTLPSGCKSEI